MKIAIVDETSTRGKGIASCIQRLFSDVELTTVLGNCASGPRASAEIHRFADKFDYIFAHHSQLNLAQQLSEDASIILYTLFYDNDAERKGGLWIQEHVSETGGVSDDAILKAIGGDPKIKPQKMDVMPSSKYGLWHALASSHLNIEKLKPYINALKEQHGESNNLDEFEKLYSEKPERAYAFANGIKSSIKNYGQKSDQGLRFDQSVKYAKREFNVLFIDDNKENYLILKDKLKQYLLDNDESFESNVIYIQTTENLQEQFKKLQNIQAVIFDDRFPADVNISEIIENLIAIRPNIPFYISGSNILEFEDEKSQQDAPIFLSNVRAYEYKDEKRATALFDALLADLKARVETPYFTALNKYATERKSAFHALPITDGGSLNDSVWTREFTDFYQRKFFAAETSSTKSPLSSVFSPQGELQRSLEKAAAAFHSDKSLFVTSGTTVSNLIVYKIHIREGDLVLLDWNCHKSHHNAMVECGARVKYLKSEYNKNFGIAGLVSIKQILNELRELKKINETVKMISLTHPSFDGLLYNVEEIMREASKIFPGIIFFFDEAWFAYGSFYPDRKFRYRSAMLAAAKIRQEGIKKVEYRGFPDEDVRVYVTQSIHKTLSSIRQGSMLHIHDPYLVYANDEDKLHLKYMIDNAYETYITTSPNNSILASLDVARMQAEMEGFDRINRAIACVQIFKNGLQAMCHRSPAVKAMGLRVVEAEELVTNCSQDNVIVDPLKVTLYFNRVPGALAVKKLSEFNIQINKYSANTVLLLFTIGVTRGNVNHLLSSLNTWAEQVVTKEPFREDNRLKLLVTKIPDFYPGFLDEPSKQIACLKVIHDEFHANQVPNYTGSEHSLYQCAKPVLISDCLHKEHLNKDLDNNQLVAAQSITPYPPGSPIIVAGQIISKDILEYLISLKKSGGEIHGVIKNQDGDDCIMLVNQNAK